MNLRTLLSTAVVAVAGLATAVPALAETRLAFGATNSQSAHYAYFAALSKIVNDAYPDTYQASVVETGATVDNLKRMARDQLDIGLITTSTLYHAYNGVKSFDGRPVESKLLWAYSLAPQNVVVRRDSGITELADIDGQKFGPGMRGSSTEATALEVFDLLDIEPDWVRGTNGELANAIKDDRSEGFVKSAVGTSFDALTTDIAAFTPLQVLGISDEQEAAIRETLPELSIVEMPGGEMENSGPYTVWGFMIGVSARPNMDEQTAYDITKAVMENMAEQEAAFPAVQGQNLPELTLQYATSPLHPGAIRYYEEIGLTVPDHLK
ncbi:TAXI family TRAP transporter solute-binding subunit [Pseudoponticoccus marisrubri]|uniref:TRAP ABC transporter substrate-binding protein n=1 Tax=Pseudoponticoccus marisrubri TaxID=1685382 RepID=A0A0W7WHS6_9RHOB|nr:TAXI family TRAP transporter solute-binding subunit [Pseudoponticoccus marisrubri]KUF10055.1 TRAP ABC transporter substrate-binding protein [Pseudoponticoccus marisrubri]